MAMFVRLLGWLRPYRRGVVLSALLAAAAMVMTVAIPWLTGRAIDRVHEGDKPGLTALGLAVLGAGVLRPVLAELDRIREPACLETSSAANVAFYSTLGFSVVAHTADLPADAPETWVMWRAPCRRF